MSENKSNSGASVGVLGLLGILFVALKLIGIINWSWWYVTLPFWGLPFLILAGFLIVYVSALLFYKDKK